MEEFSTATMEESSSSKVTPFSTIILMTPILVND